VAVADNRNLSNIDFHRQQSLACLLVRLLLLMEKPQTIKAKQKAISLLSQCKINCPHFQSFYHSSGCHKYKNGASLSVRKALTSMSVDVVAVVVTSIKSVRKARDKHRQAKANENITCPKQSKKKIAKKICNYGIMKGGKSFLFFCCFLRGENSS